MNKKTMVGVVVATALLAAVLGVAYWSMQQQPKDSGTTNTNENTNQSVSKSEKYDPEIDPTNFVEVVDNELFALKPGTIWTYEGETDEGTEKVVTEVMSEKKMILGISNTIVWDRVYLNDSLIEETYDWYAQDRNGNVWYMGEDSKEIEDGKVLNTHGSWEAGVDRAKPGIIMKASPKVGDSYRQEYYQGEAEDEAEVLSVSERVEVPFGTFDNCLQTRDFTALEPDVNEHKYYCPEVGSITLEVGINSGERLELIDIKRP